MCIFVTQGDPVKDLMMRFMGDAEASKRFTTTADNVSQDENGLKQLIVSTPDLVYYVTPLGFMAKKLVTFPILVHYVWFTDVNLICTAEHLRKDGYLRPVEKVVTEDGHANFDAKILMNLI